KDVLEHHTRALPLPLRLVHLGHAGAGGGQQRALADGGGDRHGACRVLAGVLQRAALQPRLGAIRQRQGLQAAIAGLFRGGQHLGLQGVHFLEAALGGGQVGEGAQGHGDFQRQLQRAADRERLLQVASRPFALALVGGQQAQVLEQARGVVAVAPLAVVGKGRFQRHGGVLVAAAGGGKDAQVGGDRGEAVGGFRLAVGGARGAVVLLGGGERAL